MSTQPDGWNYEVRQVPGGDARKIVTLAQDGMCWVGIRAFDHSRRRWLNNGEPETATVKAWRDLPEPCRGFWDRGILHVPRQREDALMQAMPGPTLPEGDGYS